MKQFLTALLLGLILIGFNACRKVVGKGPIVSETRVTGEFSEISFAVPGELTYIPSDDYEITIQAQRNILDYIDTYVSGDELKIKVRDNLSIRTSEDIRVTVKAPGVRSLAVNGSGNIKAMNDFVGNYLRLKINGSGKITVNRIEAEQLEARISGSGHMEAFSGFATHEDISIDGSGHVDLLDIDAQTAKTNISGSGTIRLYVTDELDVRISGSGDVYYDGDPSVDTHISGSGRVVRL